MFLLDTNVVSEAVTQRPNPQVTKWLAAVDEDAVFISVVSLAEVRAGINLMEDGRRRRRLNDWLTKELPIRFAGRILVIDAIVADAAGAIVSDRILKGRKMQAMDALIAATAVTYGLTVVTRDVRDFVGSVTSILNPWLANEA